VKKSHCLSASATVQIAGDRRCQSQNDQSDDRSDEERASHAADLFHKDISTTLCVPCTAFWNLVLRKILRSIESAAFEFFLKIIDFIQRLLGTILGIFPVLLLDLISNLVRVELDEDNDGNNHHANDDHRNEEHSKKAFAILLRSTAANSCYDHDDAPNNDNQDGHIGNIVSGKSINF